MTQGQYFDATQFEPDVGGGSAHPIGKFQARIATTGWKPNKANDNWYFQIDYQTPQGTIPQRFNLRHENPVTVAIAQKQLSAVCYATGIHRLDLNNNGLELHNAQLTIDVRAQKDNSNYTEVGAVYDIHGNDPKTIAAGRAQQTAPQTAPVSTGASGGAGGPFANAAPVATPPVNPFATAPAAVPPANPNAPDPNWRPGAGYEVSGGTAGAGAPAAGNRPPWAQ